MNCREVKGVLPLYLEGEVTPAEIALVRKHLAGCPDCQRRLEALAATRHHVSQYLHQQGGDATPPLEAWNQLQSRLAQQKQPAYVRFLAHLTGNRPVGRQAPPFRRRALSWSALMAIFFLVLSSFIVANPVAPVSAQEILDRSTDAEATLSHRQGILHTRVENYFNTQVMTVVGAAPLPKGGHVVVDQYMDLQTGWVRSITLDPDNGQPLTVSGYDGQFVYVSQRGPGAPMPGVPMPGAQMSGGLVVSRFPAEAGFHVQGEITASPPAGLVLHTMGPAAPPLLGMEDLFEQARNNPNVRYVGVEQWEDGRLVHALSFQLSMDPASLSPIVSTLYFDAQSYMLVGSQETIVRDGRVLLVSSHRQMQEVLPPGALVTWNLSDIPGVIIVDRPAGDIGPWPAQTIRNPAPQE